ncbi:hypothetical protein ACSN7O_003582 [Enterobacter chuandaensis]
MKTAVLKQPESATIITPDDYTRLIAGQDKEEWPAICCVACARPLYLSTLSTSGATGYARFRHGVRRTANDEHCPVGENTVRFSGFEWNERCAPVHVASIRRAQFLMPERFLEAWRVCRQLCGGTLSVEEFAGMVTVADSFNLWQCTFLPPWSIPLLLMLMRNHPSGQGSEKLYYRLRVMPAPTGTPWEDCSKFLEAYWLESGAQVNEPEKGTGNFRSTIPLTEEFTLQILTEASSCQSIPDDTVREMSYYRHILKNQNLF